ncbi:MAG: transporter [Cyclobacteriaceae bacterium]|nr:transporter [Cyclobacteriaceae bacterium HetDA_MAG_MS6]
MTDAEFDVLDELYFVTSFEELSSSSDLTTEVLIHTLWQLYEKGWVKIMSSVDEELESDQVDQGKFFEYWFLASKKGLLAHNTK